MIEADELRGNVMDAISRAAHDDMAEAFEIRDVGIVKIIMSHGLTEQNIKQLKKS